MFDYFNLSDTKDYTYMLKSLGADVTKNGEPIRALVTLTELEQKNDDRRISSLAPLSRGDLINYEGRNYMMISEIATTRYNKYKGVMRLLSSSIIFNQDCVYKTAQCYIEVEGFSVQSGGVISTARGSIDVHMSDNELAKSIKIGNRFIKYGQAFKVVGIDRLSRPGMAIITADKDAISTANDDLVNDIAGGLTCSVRIRNIKPINILQGNTVQLSLSTDQPVTYTTSDPNIVTVSNTGLITGKGEGTAIVTVARVSNPDLYDTVQVNITLPDKFTIISTSSTTSLEYDKTATITNKVLKNSIEVPDAVTHSLVYADKQTVVPSTVATLTTSSNRSVIVRNVNKTGVLESIFVKVTLNSDPTVVEYVPISLAYYIGPNYRITITSNHVTPNSVAYNEQIHLERIIYNNNVQEDGHSVTWTLVGADQITPVPNTIATMNVDLNNELDVHNYNETGKDTDIYVKATMNGDHPVTAYYALKVVSQVVQKTITISPTTTATPFTGTPPADDRIPFSSTKNYVRKVNTGAESVTWKLTTEAGGTTNYATLQNTFGDSTTVVARSRTTPAGLVILTATLNSDPNIQQTYRIRIGDST